MQFARKNASWPQCAWHTDGRRAAAAAVKKVRAPAAPRSLADMCVWVIIFACWSLTRIAWPCKQSRRSRAVHSWRREMLSSWVECLFSDEEPRRARVQPPPPLSPRSLVWCLMGSGWVRDQQPPAAGASASRIRHYPLSWRIDTTRIMFSVRDQLSRIKNVAGMTFNDNARRI